LEAWGSSSARADTSQTVTGRPPRATLAWRRISRLPSTNVSGCVTRGSRAHPDTTGRPDEPPIPLGIRWHKGARITYATNRTNRQAEEARGFAPRGDRPRDGEDAAAALTGGDPPPPGGRRRPLAGGDVQPGRVLPDAAGQPPQLPALHVGEPVRARQHPARAGAHPRRRRAARDPRRALRRVRAGHRRGRRDRLPDAGDR